MTAVYCMHVLSVLMKTLVCAIDNEQVNKTPHTCYFLLLANHLFWV